MTAQNLDDRASAGALTPGTGTPGNGTPGNGTPEQAMEEHYRLPVHWLKEYRIRRFNREEKQRIVFRLLASAGATRADDRPDGVDFLDVGCGDGRWRDDIATRRAPGSRIAGVDHSERAIAFARLICPDHTFTVSSGSQLDFPDHSFDLVSAIEVIEHVPDGSEETFLAEIFRVLRPGGALIFTTPSIRAPMPPTHYRHYTLDRLQDLHRDAGFDVVETRGFMRRCVGRSRWVVDWLNEFPLLWKIGRYYHRESDPGVATCLIVLARKPKAP